jgi:transposase
MAPEGLIDKKAPGQRSKLKDTHRAALAKMIEEGPIPAIHGVVRWRLIYLCQWVFEEFRVTVSVQTMSRELRTMGLLQALGASTPSCADRWRDRRF